ncbi:MAG: quinone-dependent dihydroorotate dehydrogenase [Bacteroidia bacterium]
MYSILKAYLFSLDPEKAHHFTIKLLKFFFSKPVLKFVLNPFQTKLQKKDSFSLMGITFPSRLGLAAGFDKNAEFYDEMLDLGFGFVEIGTVTPLPQDGNPKPRLFRLVEDQAIINRMGFNNVGLEQVVRNLKSKKPNQIIGGNIGKNKITPNDQAIQDYIIAFNGIYEHVDYLVVNVSSPNTPGLRDLQSVSFMETLLERLDQERKRMMKSKPILLKIAPDLNESDFQELCVCVKNSPIEGMIISNTTIGRNGLITSEKMVEDLGAGGLSGAPLTRLSTQLVRDARKILGKDKVIIGSGGIMNAKDAKEKIEAGADLIQIYSGFIYHGPALIREITKALRSH